MGISIAFQFDVRIEIQKTDKLINLTPNILFFFFNFGDFFTLKCTCPFEQVASNINFHYFFFNWYREIRQALMSSPAIYKLIKTHALWLVHTVPFPWTGFGQLPHTVTDTQEPGCRRAGCVGCDYRSSASSSTTWLSPQALPTHYSDLEQIV